MEQQSDTTTLAVISLTTASSTSMAPPHQIFMDIFFYSFPHMTDMTFEDSPSQSFTTIDQIKMAGLWREILGTPEFGPDDSFFDLGGHSLLVTQLMFRLRYVGEERGRREKERRERE